MKRLMSLALLGHCHAVRLNTVSDTLHDDVNDPNHVHGHDHDNDPNHDHDHDHDHAETYNCKADTLWKTGYYCSQHVGSL